MDKTKRDEETNDPIDDNFNPGGTASDDDDWPDDSWDWFDDDAWPIEPDCACGHEELDHINKVCSKCSCNHYEPDNLEWLKKNRGHASGS